MIKLNQPIPERLNCSNLLYLLGKMHFAGQRNPPSRVWWFHWLFHRYVIHSVNCYFLLRSLAVMLALPTQLSEQDELYLHFLGDLSVTVNLRYYYSTLLATSACIMLLYHWIHYHGTRRNASRLLREVTLQDIAPFRLLTGRISPYQTGLDRAQCVALLHHAHLYTRWCPIIEFSINSILIFGCGTVFVIRSVQINCLGFFGLVAILLNSLSYMIFGGYFCNSTLYHMFYLGLLCKYFR